MVQRAFSYQQCKVCGLRTHSKAEMDEHAETFHGPRNEVADFRHRAKDQKEFQPFLANTPWGSDLR